MNSAFEKLGAELATIQFRTPRFPVICNVDACPVSEPDQIRQSLQDQVTGTVCWTETQELLVDQEKCDLFIELGPGGILAGLLNRTRKGTPCVSIDSCESLQAALPLIRG
jgi:[acyl-carrier-protein] S-malonyltransferase